MPADRPPAPTTVVLDSEAAALLDGLNGSATAWTVAPDGAGFSVVPAVYWRRRFRAVRAETTRLTLQTADLEARLVAVRAEAEQLRADADAKAAKAAEASRHGEALATALAAAQAEAARLAGELAAARADADGQRVAVEHYRGLLVSTQASLAWRTANRASGFARSVRRLLRAGR